MNELDPGWCAETVRTERETPKRAFRFRQEDVERSRKRGSARGARSRYGLKNLPPIDPENPEAFE